MAGVAGNASQGLWRRYYRKPGDSAARGAVRRNCFCEFFKGLRVLPMAVRGDCASTTNSTFLLGAWHLCTIVAADCRCENEFDAEGGVNR